MQSAGLEISEIGGSGGHRVGCRASKSLKPKRLPDGSMGIEV